MVAIAGTALCGLVVALMFIIGDGDQSGVVSRDDEGGLAESADGMNGAGSNDETQPGKTTASAAGDGSSATADDTEDESSHEVTPVDGGPAADSSDETDVDTSDGSADGPPPDEVDVPTATGPSPGTEGNGGTPATVVTEAAPNHPSVGGTGPTTVLKPPQLPPEGIAALDPPTGSTPDTASYNGPEPTEDELMALGRAMKNARIALNARDFVRASTQLATADRLARLPEHRAMVERLKLLADYSRQFQAAFKNGLEKLKSTDELVIDEHRVAVVEVNPQRIILRAAGQNRSYPMSDLPDQLVLAIADLWFDLNAASTGVFKGAFYAVGPDANAAEARRFWDEARRAGADPADLPLVLDDNYDLTRGPGR